jgi:type IV pilus biogenesis protein CpaD/CtpE
MARITNYIGTGLIAACMGLTACAGSSAVKEDYGNSVRNMISAQTTNPNAATENRNRTADRGDGQRSEVIMEAYREISTEPDTVDRSLIIDIGGGGR